MWEIDTQNECMMAAYQLSHDGARLPLNFIRVEWSQSLSLRDVTMDNQHDNHWQ